MPVPDSSKVVPRPIPKAQTEDPRSFQIGQLQRRFKPEQIERDGSTIFTFQMTPSDPDFPYEIEALECEMRVPDSFPTSGKPALTVRNKDIPRGFQINIERGFDAIVAGAPGATLLGLTNRLDKQLETILAGRMAETVKIVSNTGQSKKPVQKGEPQTQATEYSPEPVHKKQSDVTNEQREKARIKRQSDVRQLEARFSRLQSFSKSADGSVFTLPLDSLKRSAWPEALQSLRAAQITVPELYPLSPVELHLGSESNEARAVERAFKKRSGENPEATITQQMNYLSQHLTEMSVGVLEEVHGQSQSVQPRSWDEPRSTADAPKATVRETESQRSHLQYIPRPPEWIRAADLDDGSDSEGSGSTFDTENSDDGREDETVHPSEEPTSSAPAERGILLSFPHLELHGVELLELTSLNIKVKCERCKDSMDIERLRNTAENSKAHETSCKKCANAMAIQFRGDMIHANSVRAGYLDLDGCTVIDMLPSQFMPTCSECSSSYPAPGVSAVRGDSAMAICRECHKPMSFRIQEVKFLQVSAAAIRASRAPGRKKARENLGITAGTALPQQGRCSHYRKSYRWFRFLCCGKVFPCDRCHDDQSDHPNEFASRMLCGFCSREQNYRPEDCGICHAALTGKRGTGFWEGGKGTRDPLRMSKKDPRKYKRRPGVKPKA